MSGPFQDRALALFAGGHRVVPIPLGHKGVFIEGWASLADTQDEASVRELVRTANSCGIGILAKRTAGVDIDVRDGDLAQRLAGLAHGTLGWTVERIGAAPKLLLPYRVEVPFRKVTSREFVLPGDAPGDKPHRVEVLGDGQQWVAYHTHPETGRPYHWPDGELPDRDDLPELTVEAAVEFIVAAEAMLLAAGGVPRQGHARPGMEGASSPRRMAWRAPTRLSRPRWRSSRTISTTPGGSTSGWPSRARSVTPASSSGTSSPTDGKTRTRMPPKRSGTAPTRTRSAPDRSTRPHSTKAGSHRPACSSIRPIRSSGAGDRAMVGAGPGGGQADAKNGPDPEVEPVVTQPWPEPLAAEAYHGIVGEIVRRIEPETEADPAALLFQLLAAAGNVIGSEAYARVEATRHPPRLWVTLVGRTSKGRKGTSWEHIRALMGSVAVTWAGNAKGRACPRAKGYQLRTRPDRAGSQG